MRVNLNPSFSERKNTILIIPWVTLVGHQLVYMKLNQIGSMVKVNVNTDCGNSPKMKLLKSFMIALAEHDIEYLMATVTDTITWDIVGHRMMATNRDEFKQAMTTASDVTEITLNKVITHGHNGSVNGMVITNDKTYGYCLVIGFKNASGKKIKEITSYIVAL